jgi:hypothetical protein
VYPHRNVVSTGNWQEIEYVEQESYSRCRVGQGGYPPWPPTDPDVRVDASGSSGHGFCCARPESRGDPGARERVALLETSEALPRQAGSVGAATEPLPPEPPDLVSEAAQRVRVAGNPIVGPEPTFVRPGAR